MALPKQLFSELHSGKRWGLAATASACICLLWFAYLDRDGCWFYWRGTSALTIFVFPWLWFLALFGLKTKGRLILVVCTLLGSVFLPPVHTVHIVAAESSAVARLRSLHSDVETYRFEQHLSGYPRTLPNVEAARQVQKDYRFEYLPTVSSDGTIASYVITATPIRRSCGCARSFTIAEDGRFYYTMQDRAAATSDQLLQ